MDVIRGAAELRGETDAARGAGRSVAFVPTMGALHDGHRSLVHRARDERATVVVSIFVNPLQFADPGDLDAYPRDEDTDLAICEELGVDLVWAPSADEVYPPGVDLARPDPGPVGETFEGASRPGHFHGVLTVVHRLFDVVGPSAAYFGEKDAQQLFLVRCMVDAEAMPVELVACPTIRDPDGLAVSSRNDRLSPTEREQAGCLFLALSEAATLARAGATDPGIVVAAMAREVGATPLARLDYASVVDDRTFGSLERLAPDVPARAVIAARFPSARLIDNLRLPGPAAGGTARRLSSNDPVGHDGPSSRLGQLPESEGPSPRA